MRCPACLFLAHLYRAEQGIADRLRRLLQGAPPWPSIDADRALPWIESQVGLALAASQAEAVRLALRKHHAIWIAWDVALG